MMTRFSMLLAVVAAACSFQAKAQFETTYFVTKGGIVDTRLFQWIQPAARALIDEGKTPPLPVLAAQLSKTQYAVTLQRPNKKIMPNAALYAKGKESVLVIATIYTCDKCPNDHIRAASGFVIGEDGIGVTSYHIFEGNATDEKHDVAHVAMDYQGNVYPISAVLAANKNDDVAVFRMNTQGIKIPALSLGEDPAIGDPVTVIGHPHSMFYSFTQGVVSRLYVREGGEKMSITADFSQGSSGGPVFDAKGNVIGVVSATLSLYNSDNNLQMVSKEVIPVNRIKALITPN